MILFLYKSSVVANNIEQKNVRDEEMPNNLKIIGWDVLEIIECEVKSDMQVLNPETLKVTNLK
jgi:G:T-mismatch repair DNA endonuclease (very short patch repair protein)